MLKRVLIDPKSPGAAQKLLDSLTGKTVDKNIDTPVTTGAPASAMDTQKATVVASAEVVIDVDNNGNTEETNTNAE